MSFQQGLSGLNVASKSLDVIGNNIANSGVAGFKGATAQFGDAFASAIGGGGGGAVGIGAQVQGVMQQFSQGNITATNNPMDLAINGGGFFRMSDQGSVTFSRNGQFHVDKTGTIVNTTGLALTGYAASSTGQIIASAPGPLVISTGDLAPLATSTFAVTAQLQSSATPTGTSATFNSAITTTFNNSTSGTIYDTIGSAHVLTLYFQKDTVTANTWNVYPVIDGAVNAQTAAAPGQPVGSTVAVKPGFSQLAFTTSGALNTTTSPQPYTVTIDLTAVGAAQSPVVVPSAVTSLPVAVNFTGSTQYGTPFSVSKLTQDGYASGRLTSMDVSADGTMVGHYNNGKTQNMGQVVLANFANPNALTSMGQNQWKDNTESGLPIVGVPANGALGALQASAIEESNVDLTAELVNMITAQRIYQANAQSIKTQDSVLQTLVNLR